MTTLICRGGTALGRTTPPAVPFGSRCPFLLAARAITGPAIPALVQTFKSMCPFLGALAHSDKDSRSFSAQPRLQESETFSSPKASVFETLSEKAPSEKGPSRAAAAALLAQTDTMLAEKLMQIKKEGRYRVFFDIEREAGKYPHALRHSETATDEVVTFCSNDYLCMGQNPVVTGAMKDVLDKNGAGAGGTRNISGTTPYHSALERELASLHQKDRSLVFTSCFVANDSAISTLGKLLPGCEIFSDADNHSSLIEGVRHSGCPKHIWRHNDVAHLEELLAKAPKKCPKLIVFESVYSMDGDIAPIKEICDVADKYGALTFLDEVHAVGMYGATGAGVAEQRGLANRLSIISGTLAKAYGVMGGYIAGSELLIDSVRSFAPGFIFTSSLPPCVAAGATASIRHLKQSSVERMMHQERAAQLKTLLKRAGIPYMHSESHIVPVMIGNADLCKKASDLLLNKHKIYVQPINFPTVPRGTERLRFTPGPMHTEEMLSGAVAALQDVWQTLGLALTSPSSK